MNLKLKKHERGGEPERPAGVVDEVSPVDGRTVARAEDVERIRVVNLMLHLRLINLSTFVPPPAPVPARSLSLLRAASAFFYKDN